MTTRVDIDITLPVGPDGHAELKVTIPDVHALKMTDARLIFLLIDKVSALAPPAEAAGAAASLPAVLRAAGGRT